MDKTITPFDGEPSGRGCRGDVPEIVLKEVYEQRFDQVDQVAKEAIWPSLADFLAVHQTRRTRRRHRVRPRLLHPHVKAGTAGRLTSVKWAIHYPKRRHSFVERRLDLAASCRRSSTRLLSNY